MQHLVPTRVAPTLHLAGPFRLFLLAFGVLEAPRGLLLFTRALSPTFIPSLGLLWSILAGREAGGQTLWGTPA